MSNSTKTPEEIFRVVQTTIEEVLERSVEMSPDSALKKDLRIQSIDILETIFSIEKKIGVSVDLFDFFQKKTMSGKTGMSDIVIRDLVTFIHEKLSAGAR